MVKVDFVKKISVIALIVSFTISVFGCSSYESDFPEIPTPTTNPSYMTEPEATEFDGEANYKISVALPYSEETVNYLFKLYYAKNNGLLKDSDTGATVSLNMLDSINLPYAVEYYYAPNTGMSASSIVESNSSIPDLFITNELDACIENSVCLRLNDYCYDNELYSTSNINYDLVKSCMVNESLYAVPHSLSVPMIYGNRDYIPEEYCEDYKLSKNEFDKLLTSLSIPEVAEDEEGEGDEEGIVPFVSAKDLVPYLVSAYNNPEHSIRSFMMNEEYKANNTLFYSVADNIDLYISTLYESELSKNSNEDGSNPVITRNASMWLGDSTEITYFLSYYPDKLCFFSIPSFADSDDLIPYVNVYPLCVSANSSNPTLACDFASFISLDIDAQLLINRLEYKIGMLPVINSPLVWDTVIENDEFGYIASLYESMSKEYVCTFKSVNSDVENRIENFIASCYSSDNTGSFKLVNIYE